MAETGAASTQAPTPRQHRHKTLSAYYPHLHTLHDYLLSAPASSQRRVLLESDNEEYKRLVLGALCGTSADVLLPAVSHEVSTATQQEVVDRVIAEVARKCLREDTKDVLISGNKVSPSVSQHMNPCNDGLMGTVRGRRSARSCSSIRPCRAIYQWSSRHLAYQALADPAYEVGHARDIISG